MKNDSSTLKPQIIKKYIHNVKKLFIVLDADQSCSLDFLEITVALSAYILAFCNISALLSEGLCPSQAKTNLLPDEVDGILTSIIASNHMLICKHMHPYLIQANYIRLQWRNLIQTLEWQISISQHALCIIQNVWVISARMSCTFLTFRFISVSIGV